MAFVDADTVDRICEAFQRSPGKSIRRADRELHIPRTTVQKIFHHRLKLRAYKMQIEQAQTDNNNSFADVFRSDESVPHVFGMVETHLQN